LVISFFFRSRPHTLQRSSVRSLFIICLEAKKLTKFLDNSNLQLLSPNSPFRLSYSSSNITRRHRESLITWAPRKWKNIFTFSSSTIFDNNIIITSKNTLDLHMALYECLRRRWHLIITPICIRIPVLVEDVHVLFPDLDLGHAPSVPPPWM
jgi:hypothetical protein